MDSPARYDERRTRNSDVLRVCSTSPNRSASDARRSTGPSSGGRTHIDAVDRGASVDGRAPSYARPPRKPGPGSPIPRYPWRVASPRVASASELPVHELDRSCGPRPDGWSQRDMTTRPTKSVAQYVAGLTPDRRAILTAIRKTLRQCKTLQEEMGVNPSGDIVMYKDQKRYVFGLVDRKDGVRLCALGLPLIRPVLEKYGPKFGKLRVGVYCFRFKQLDEIDQPLLEEFVEAIGELSGVRA